MSENSIIPEFWSSAKDSSGSTVLTYAVRAGKAKWLLALLGALCTVGGGWGAYWLLAGAELTVFGVIFIVLVPGLVILFGVHCLGTAFWYRTQYRLRPHQLVIDDLTLLGHKITTIAHSAVTHIEQQYFPPSGNSAAGSPGSWTTFIFFNDGGATKVIAVEGIRSKHERDWLGPMIADWADKPLRYSDGD